MFINVLGGMGDPHHLLASSLFVVWATSDRDDAVDQSLRGLAFAYDVNICARVL